MKNHIIPTHVPKPAVLRREFKKIIFGKDGRPRCPRCDTTRVRSLKKEERWRCRLCRHPFSLKSVCWLKGSKLSLEVIYLIVRCWQKSYTVQLAMDRTGLSYPTILAWYEKLRMHVPVERYDTLLEEEVVCDEMFTHDTAIIGAKQKGTRNIALKILHHKHPNKTDAVYFLERFVRSNVNLFTDGGGIYRGIDKTLGIQSHTHEIHSKFEFSLTAEIEGLWGVFRTFIRRMYHHVTYKKLQQYVCEFCLRFRQDEIFNSPFDYFDICLGEKPFAL